jgi:hypothetical protein
MRRLAAAGAGAVGTVAGVVAVGTAEAVAVVAGVVAAAAAVGVATAGTAGAAETAGSIPRGAHAPCGLAQNAGTGGMVSDHTPGAGFFFLREPSKGA